MQILTLRPGPHRMRIRILARPTSESWGPRVWGVVPVASSEGSTCAKREARLPDRRSSAPRRPALAAPRPAPRAPPPRRRGESWTETVAAPEPGRLAGRGPRDAAPRDQAAQSLSSARGRQRRGGREALEEGGVMSRRSVDDSSRAGGGGDLATPAGRCSDGDESPCS